MTHTNFVVNLSQMHIQSDLETLMLISGSYRPPKGNLNVMLISHVFTLGNRGGAQLKKMGV
jgi:hypothetical protein